MKVHEALKIARSHNLDLVEVNPSGEFPVCKILDFGKYKYESKRKLQEAKKKQRVVHLKEIKLRPNIGKGDLEIKTRSIQKFLEKKDKVKISMRFRGREMAHQDIGRTVLESILVKLEDIYVPDVKPKNEGNSLDLILEPKTT